MSDEKVKKKDTVRISQKDLLKLLAEHEHMTNQITELQTRGTELITENRELKAQLEELSSLQKDLDSIKELYNTKQSQNDFAPVDLYNPDIYIDGSRHY